jgi:ubiquinone/menaquinone biosynthesis C-methylase UbiE
LNLPRYPAAVTDLILAEPDSAMLRRLSVRVAAWGRPVGVVRADAAALPFSSRHFDTVVATLVLCTVPDVPAALAEIARVLRPRGRLLLLEHVRSADPALARWQDRLNPLQRFVGLGCECNRATTELVEEAGFEVLEREDFDLPAAYPIVRPAVRVVAVPRAGHAPG